MQEQQELQVPDGVPEGLFVSLITYLDDPDRMPPQGSAGLRAMVRTGGTPIPADLDWIQAQEELFPRAQRVLEKVHAIAPMPTTQDIMDGIDVRYPDWVGTIWAETLLHPWSQDLEQAIEEGEAYVSAKASA